MELIELFFIAVGISMDAFAVSICKGLSLKGVRLKDAGVIGLYFGLFQAIMPLTGYILSSRFKNMITQVDHWIVFLLLFFIGIGMIKEARKETGNFNTSVTISTMITLAIATSIDALAVGVSLAVLNVSVVPAIIFIGVTTFVLSFAGTYVGNIFGCYFKSYAEIAGGLILIIMGAKMLLEHLNFLNL